MGRLSGRLVTFQFPSCPSTGRCPRGFSSPTNIARDHRSGSSAWVTSSGHETGGERCTSTAPPSANAISGQPCNAAMYQRPFKAWTL